MKQVHLVEHPLIDHSLTILRDKNTQTEEFRKNAAVVSRIVLLDALRHIQTTATHIETPLAHFDGKKLVDDVVVVPVLRAGLAMLFAVQDLLPTVGVGFVGLERDEETAVAREYYRKFPKMVADAHVIVLDPMLATGGSFDDTVGLLKAQGATRLTCACIVAAPEGIERIGKNHPDVQVFTAAVDSHLNGKKYIVPGLGDFGDRYFGTV